MIRVSLKSVASQLAKRHLHKAAVAEKAFFFGMPAMSPTMEEGGIVDWKFKKGDHFQSGDVLVEVETDKATIDVEAQDDGIMAEILVQNGAKKIPINEPIAILCEPEDDLATLEMPELKKVGTSAPVAETAVAEKPVVEEPVVEKKEVVQEQVKPATPSATSASGVFNIANPKQNLYPSVLVLLHANHITPEEALAKIPASGPQGRILKGDVLLYLGKIKKEALTKITEYANKGTKLDLSNIELRSNAPVAKAEAAEQAPVKKVKEPVVLTEVIKLPSLPGSLSEYEVTRVIQRGIDSLIPQVHGKTVSKSQYYDAAFEDLVYPEPLAPRFSVSFSLKSTTPVSGAVQDSLFDSLVSSSSTSAKNEKVSQPIEYDLQIETLVFDKYGDSMEKANKFMELLQKNISNMK